MLDILTIIHSFADTQTAARIRQTCRRLGTLTPRSILYRYPNHDTRYEYRVGSKLHRLDGPARKNIYGYRSWYSRGVAHREYHPQCATGNCVKYIVESRYHREDGPSIVNRYGTKAWYMRGKLHRKIGPAEIWHGETWYTLGKWHRLDGPALYGIYTIRGKGHRISSSTDIGWVVNEVVIRV